MATGVSSAVDAISTTVTGASLTAETATLTVAVAVPPFPSLAVYWKLATPLKLAVGVKTTLPLPSRTTVPFVAPWTEVRASASPSGSESLPSRDAARMVTAVSSTVEALSARAVGTSLTGVTVTVTVAGAVPPWPSSAV